MTDEEAMVVVARVAALVPGVELDPANVHVWLDHISDLDAGQALEATMELERTWALVSMPTPAVWLEHYRQAGRVQEPPIHRRELGAGTVPSCKPVNVQDALAALHARPHPDPVIARRGAAGSTRGQP